MYRDFHGTIRAQRGFNPDVTAEALHAAMKGWGCDKKTMVHELTRINSEQRQQVMMEYKTKYGEDFRERLKSELSGDLEEVMLGLIETPTSFDAMQLHKAIHQGIGTKENVLIEILCSRTNNELEAIKEEYRERYGKELEEDIVGDTSGNFRKLLVSLVQGNRDSSWNVDRAKAREDAQKLFDEGERKMGTEESTFNSILVSENLRQLDRVFQDYEQIAGHSFETAIKKEFGGDMEEGFLALVQCVQNRARYFAQQLNDAMKGFGTRDSDLIRVVVSRAEVDLALIRSEYENMFGKPLSEAINSECSGAYRDALVLIVEGN